MKKWFFASIVLVLILLPMFCMPSLAKEEKEGKPFPFDKYSGMDIKLSTGISAYYEKADEAENLADGWVVILVYSKNEAGESVNRAYQNVKFSLNKS